MIRGARIRIRLDIAEPPLILQKLLGIRLSDFPPVPLFFPRLLQNVVVYVRHVLHVCRAVPNVPQVSAQHVKKSIGERVSQVRYAIGRYAADIHADAPVPSRKYLFPPRP